MAYEGKILQLKEIRSTGNKYFLSLDLDFKGRTEILWEIDNFTGSLLENLIEFDGKSKYRLSFYTPFTPGNEKRLCFVTKTYLGESEPIYFLASQDFINSLMEIKKCENINELDKRIFTLAPSKKVMDALEHGRDPYDRRFLKKHKYRLGLVYVPIFSMIIFILISYLAGYFQRDIKMEQKVSAAPIDSQEISQQEVLETEEDSLEEPEVDPEENYEEDFEEKILEPEEIPNREYFELENTVNYKIPDGKVALTFDDGPSKYTREIVDILKEYNIPATFFFVSRLVPYFAEEVKYVDEEGYAIGSHSVSHAQLTKVSEGKRKTEILDSMATIGELIEKDLVLFRPPYGSRNKQIDNFIYNKGYKIVLWNIDTRDWEVRNEDKIMEKIEKHQASGSIILLHEIEPTVKVLPRIIEYLQSLDLEIVNLK